jgi:hypothetical protein
MLTKWHYLLREVEIPARLDISRDPQRHQRQFNQEAAAKIQGVLL